MKFKTIYMHIGSDKTGSTSIQSYFDNNRKEHIDKYNIYYAPGRWQQRLASIFNDHRVKGSGDANSDLTKEEILRQDTEYLEEFNNFIAKVKPGGSLVLSFEGFHHLPDESIVRAKNFLNAYSNNIKIIYYVRPFFSYAISAMSQTVKMGRLPLSSPPTVNYKSNIERYLKVFTKNDLIIRPFKRNYLIDNDVIHDFLHIIKIKKIKKVIEYEPLNESISNDAFIIGKNIIRTVLRSDEKVNNNQLRTALAPILLAINGDKIKLTKTEVDCILNSVVGDINFLRVEFGIDLHEEQKKYIYTDKELKDIKSEKFNILIDSISTYLTKIILEDVKKTSRTALENHRVDVIRDLALSFEIEDIQTALELMRIAQKLRPNGSVINSKVKEYLIKKG